MSLLIAVVASVGIVSLLYGIIEVLCKVCMR